MPGFPPYGPPASHGNLGGGLGQPGPCNLTQELARVNAAANRLASILSDIMSAVQQVASAHDRPARMQACQALGGAAGGLNSVGAELGAAISALCQAANRCS